MKLNANHIQVSKTARYFTFGEANKNVKRFWIVCHGYGQLANRFLQQFQNLNTKENFIVAPEGLHRFYKNGFTGKIGASWMTKEDRLNDIKDNGTYLQTIYDKFVPLLKDDVQIVLFGFSQGCATHCRWLAEAKPNFNFLVLWGGFLPEDINYQPLLPYLENKQIVFAYGDEDPFLTVENRIEKFRHLAKEANVNFTEWVFEGKHETRKAVLVDFEKQLANN